MRKSLKQAALIVWVIISIASVMGLGFHSIQSISAINESIMFWWVILTSGTLAAMSLNRLIEQLKD